MAGFDSPGDTCEPDASLPALTGLVWRYSSYAYTLPVPVLLFGVFFLRRSSGDSVGLEERLRELEKLCVMEVVDPESGKVVARQVPAPNAHQKQLLEALKLELPATVPAAEVIVGTRKKINNVRQTRMALS